MIKRFTYENLDTGWKLEPVEFGLLNLLVGPSGVGKTLIFRALLDVQHAALEGLRGRPSGNWKLELELEGRSMVWEARTRVERMELIAPGEIRSETERLRRHTDARFEFEKLILDGEEIVWRDSQKFEYRGAALPTLDDAQSCLELLGPEEEPLKPFRSALAPWWVPEGGFSSELGAIASVQDAADAIRSVGSDLEALRRQVQLVPYLKLYLLQELHPDQFRELVADFCDIFPTVKELKVAPYSAFEVRPNLGAAFMANALAVGMKEEGVGAWVLHTQFSAGMAKTLKLLIEIRLAPAGAVLFIDELENSLGVNCLPEVQEHLLNRPAQVLITSHHPRVINKIPFRYWKLVTRHGSAVKVLDASEVRALQTASPLEKFTLLLNAEEYEEAIS